MPRKAINYDNALVYKLCCNDTSITDIYIGSTTNFTKRKWTHHSDSKIKNHRKVYEFINSNGGWSNWSMVLIEFVKCNTSLELCKVEREYIDLLKPSLNTYNSWISLEEKKKQSKQNKKEYYKKNKEQIKEYFQKYREQNKEQIKEYLQKNKEKIKQKQKERISQLYTCPICNSKIKLGSKARHQRTKKCLSSIIS